MQIKQILHSDEELIARFGNRFYERLTRLLSVYRRRYKDTVFAPAYKLANMALCFCMFASSNGVKAAETFENMLYGRCQEVLMLDERPFLFEEDETQPTVGLFWDTSCLLMEEEETDFEKPQWLYDFVDRHERYAYKPTVVQEVDDSASRLSTHWSARTKTAHEEDVFSVAKIIDDSPNILIQKGNDKQENSLDSLAGELKSYEMLVSAIVDYNDIERAPVLETLLSRVNDDNDGIYRQPLKRLRNWMKSHRGHSSLNEYYAPVIVRDGSTLNGNVI